MGIFNAVLMVRFMGGLELCWFVKRRNKNLGWCVVVVVLNFIVAGFVVRALQPLSKVHSDIISFKSIYICWLSSRLHASSKKSNGGTDMMHRHVNDNITSSACHSSS